MPQKSFFEFTVNDITSEPIPLSNYKGKKAYLLVNVASAWGLTKQNYAELQVLYDRYSSKGLEILAFPCNNFGSQEPGSNKEILAFAQDKGATFPILGKLECENGDGDKTDPLYNWLKTQRANILGFESLMWNFSKFLCNTDGVVVERFGPKSSPFSIEADILKLLNAPPAEESSSKGKGEETTVDSPAAVSESTPTK